VAENAVSAELRYPGDRVMRQFVRTSQTVGLTLYVVFACACSTFGQDRRDSGILELRSGSGFGLAPLPSADLSIRSDEAPIPATSNQPHATFNGPTALDDLIARALANNREIQAARFHAQSLSARVPQAKSLPDPTLMTTVFLEEIQTAAGPQQAAMSLSQKFPWFGKRALRSQVAYYDSMAAYSRVASTELKVIEQVKRAYFDLYFVQNAVAETRRLERPLKDVIAVAKTKYETSAGKVGLESVFQAQVELAKLKTDLVKLEEAERQAQARLAGVMHLPPRTEIEAVRSFDRSRSQDMVATLVGLAESCQPEYEAFRREMARDRAAVDLACRNYWPDITTSFNWYEMGTEGLSPVSNGRDAFSIGVGVNLPIYRQRLSAAVQEAESKLCATARRYDAVRDRFQTEIETLHSQYREHYRTLTILESETLPRAEETLKLALESYRAGRAGFQQLMDVYRTLLRYRIDLHRHLALSEQALASLEKAVGCAVISQEATSSPHGSVSVRPPLPAP
jgi:outer membrane protein TolC